MVCVCVCVYWILKKTNALYSRKEVKKEKKETTTQQGLKTRRKKKKRNEGSRERERGRKGALGGTCIPVYISSTLQAFHDWQHVDKFSGWLAISCCTESGFFFYFSFVLFFFSLFCFIITICLSHSIHFRYLFFFPQSPACCVYILFDFYFFVPLLYRDSHVDSVCYFPFFISFRRAVSVDIFNAIRCYRPLRRAKDDVRSAMTMSLLSSSFFFFILLTLLAHTRKISGPWVFSSLPTPMRLILPLCTHPASAGNPSSTRDHAHANTVPTHRARIS